MTVKRFTTALAALGLGLALSACSSVSSSVSDHWPHWAGGMPADVPPRPGAPGYEDFIAHKQTDTDSSNPAATGAMANPQPPPSATVAPNNGTVAAGGLY
jgi:hypothetical protein